MIVVLVAFTLIAFAANSLLCRMALDGNLIDPVSFMTIRLVSGALVLIPISRLVAEPTAVEKTRGSWCSGFALFAYAAAFSLAYISLKTGTGALILFGSVQVTMIGAAIKSGEKLGPAQWVGLSAAMGGLVFLVLPGLTAPDPIGALLMCVAGIAWGVYSIRGKGVSAPVAMTAANFSRAAPMGILVCVLALPWVQMHLQPMGVLLAVMSGAITSGIGYTLWYKSLPRLSTTQASVVQLMVPVIAAVGGITFLSEHVTGRLIAASTLILGGVGLAITKRRSRVKAR
jgi:drug/metabolite transporter (DMT)-like permease